MSLEEGYSLSVAPLYKFDLGTNEWHAAEAQPSERACVPQLTFAQLNLLSMHSLDWVERQAALSERRYAAAATRIEALDADIVALHDVCAEALSLLLGSSYVRATFAVSLLPRDIPHHAARTVLLSKVPVAASHRVSIARHRKPGDDAPVFIVNVPSAGPPGVELDAVRLVVGGLRCTNDAATHEGAAARQQQLTWFADACRELADGGDDVVVLADSNAQHVSEDAVSETIGFIDMWAETHYGAGDDQDPGATRDGARNGLLRHLLPADGRQLRQDRILVRRGCRVTPCAPAQLWATSPLSEDDFTASQEAAVAPKGPAAVIAQTVGAKHPRDLFLSHRFGVAVSLKAGRPCVGLESVAAVLHERGAVPLPKKRPLAAVDGALATVFNIGWLAGRIAHLH